MFLFQLVTSINDDVKYYDEIEFYYIIPIMIIIIPFVYLIRIKLLDKIVHGIDLKKLQAELDEYERKEKEQQNLSIKSQE